MNKLPDVCKDCAEYGSEFCNDCLDELSNNLSQEEKNQLGKALLNIAKLVDDQKQTVANTDTQDSKV
jgi:hypothetical protein